jgi:LPXTG-motif cell wall-anchored protein
LVLLPALPAVAADPAPALSVTAPSAQNVVAGQAKAIALNFYNYGPGTAKDVILTIDTTGLKGFAELKAPDTCTAITTTVTCTMGDLTAIAHPGSSSDPSAPRLPLTLNTKSGLKPGSKASLKYSVASSNAKASTSPSDGVVPLTVGTGYDLAAGKLTDLRDVAPGGRVDMPMSVTNNGDAPAVGLLFRSSAREGLGYAERHKNCRYRESAGSDDVQQWCRFDGITLQPGETYAARKAESLSVAPDMAAGFGDYAVYALDDPEVASQLAGYDSLKPGTGGDLELVRQNAGARRSAGDVDGFDNRAGFRAVTNLGNDFAVLDASASGKEGAKVTVRPGLENRGPARERNDRGHDGDPVSIKFAVPEGASLPVVPAGCYVSTGEERDLHNRVLFPGFDAKGRPAYRCTLVADKDFYKPGDKLFASLELKIDKAVPDATAPVQLFHPGLANDGKDTNAGNDVGRIVLNPTKDPGTTTGAQTAGATTGGATTTGAQTNGGGGKELANTGSDSSSTTLIGTAAAVLIALGAGGLFVVRRRKNTGIAA